VSIFGTSSPRLTTSSRIAEISPLRHFTRTRRFVHDYFGVDYDLVWDVVTNKIPDLKRAIEHIFRT
jgi:uncharacterized protein with HEPN domain